MYHKMRLNNKPVATQSMINSQTGDGVNSDDSNHTTLVPVDYFHSKQKFCLNLRLTWPLIWSDCSPLKIHIYLHLDICKANAMETQINSVEGFRVKSVICRYHVHKATGLSTLVSTSKMFSEVGKAHYNYTVVVTIQPVRSSGLYSSGHE